MTLCFSRHQYVEFVWDQTLGDLAGLPPSCLRMVRRGAAAPDHRQRQVRDRQGLQLRPVGAARLCRMRRGIRLQNRRLCPAGSEKKGVVEAGVKYIKGSFLPRASSAIWPTLTPRRAVGDARSRHPHARHNARGAAGAVSNWSAAAAPAAGGHAGPGHLAQCRSASRLPCSHDRAFYSAPFTLVGKTLWLRATDTVVALYQDYRHLATHPRALRAGQRVTIRDHLPPEARNFFERDRRWCATQAQAVGPRCTELVDRLLGDRMPSGCAPPKACSAWARLWSGPTGGRVRQGAGARQSSLPHRQDDSVHRRPTSCRWMAPMALTPAARPCALRAQRATLFGADGTLH